jgi:dTMP kinase|tara:strand:- start:21392 stop:22066 length:675 start_codon:yes stop_codon:yes gene_type:complete
MSHPGKLIVIEGPDHVGRTLHARLLSARLKANGIATHTIGLARSELMGPLVKSHTADIHQLNWRTRSLLYATDLHDQIKHEVEPLLNAGFVVIADRYTLTPRIREQVRGGDGKWISALYSDIPEPDAVVVLHAGPRRLLNRIMFGERLEALNHFEAGMDLALSTSITSSFLQYQKMLRQQFQDAGKKIGATLIPTRLTVEQVHDKIWDSVNPVVEGMLQPISEN